MEFLPKISFRKMLMVAGVFFITAAQAVVRPTLEPISYRMPYAHQSTQKSGSWWFVHGDEHLMIFDEKKGKWGNVRERSVGITIDKHGIVLNNTPIHRNCVTIKPSRGIIWVNGIACEQMVMFRKDQNGASMYCFSDPAEQWKMTVAQALIDDYYADPTKREIPYEEQHKQELIFQLQTAGTTRDASQDIKKIMHIKVLLEACKEPCVWKLKAPAGFILSDKEQEGKIYAQTAKEVDIHYKEGSFWINKKRILKSSIWCKPQGGNGSFADRLYEGNFLFYSDGKQAYCINILDLESYVFSVLKTESWPGWPLEVNKVFAIASRTYALATALRARKNKQPYDIKCTKEHQTYRGLHGCAIIKQAVEETQGICLTYDNQPIVAMFDCCCGGIIPAHVEGLDFIQAPYLARSYACTHCKRCRIYSWKTQYTLDAFSKIVRQKHKKISKVKRVKITKRDKAGLVQQVALRGAEGQVLLSGKELYSLMADVKSFVFRIRQQGNLLIFDRARGYGHHVGLCQWGAREMVRDGWTYKRILQFYYPGTTFMKVS